AAHTPGGYRRPLSEMQISSRGAILRGQSMILRNLLAMVAIGASLTLVHVSPANAATITWDVSVTILGDGGSVGGVFSVDTTALSLLSVNLSTTAGSILPGRRIR